MYDSDASESDASARNAGAEELMELSTSDPNSMLHNLMKLMMEDNRRRDKLFLRALESQKKPDSRGSEAYQVMPDLAKTIPTFNGEEAGPYAEEWLRVIETTSNLHRWPENFKLESVRTHLKGAAYQWYLSRMEEFDSWDAFTTSSKKTFVGGLAV